MQYWNTKGRPPVAVFNPSTRHRITHSQIMLTSCAHKPLLWVVENLIELPFVGGLTGPQCKVERFLCLIFRMVQIHPSPSLVLAMLRQDVHKYLRIGALVYIRLLGSSAMLHEAKKIGLEDYRKIRVYGYPDNLSGILSTSQGSSLLSTAAAQFSQQQEALFGRKKRPRSEFDSLSSSSISSEVKEVLHEKSCEDSVSNHDNLVQEGIPLSPQYFLTHVDEITACLYGSDFESEKQLDAEKEETTQSASSLGNSHFSGASTHFLGLPLPSIDYME